MPARRRISPRTASQLVGAALCTGCALFVACQNRTGVPPSAPAIAPRVAVHSKPQPIFPGAFADVTPGSGLDFTYRNGEEADQYSILESLGGGVGLIDYDQDGRLDVFLTGGGVFGGPKKQQIQGHPNRLFRNLGDWKFRDVTADVALNLPLFYGHGCAVGDYDNDGWPDLLVTGYGRLALFHNDGGRNFVETTEAAGLTIPRDVHWSTGAAWGDIDGDNDLDLFVGHYINWSLQNHPRCPGYGPNEPVDLCPPDRFEALPPQLFLNEGNGTFREAGQSAGLRPGKALGVLIADLNQDGKLDIYVANDAINNYLYLNQGSGKFVESGVERGAAANESGIPDGSMGVDAADLRGTGQLSLFVTNYQQQAHALYRNDGRGYFDHASSLTGIRAIGQNFVGWGTGFIDFDQDGDEDLVFTHGHVIRHPSPPQMLAQRPVLMKNLQSRSDSSDESTFQDDSLSAGEYFQHPRRGRGLALGDLDNDGRTDLVISHVNAPVVLLRNIVVSRHHWLGVELMGKSPRDSIGATLLLEADGRRFGRVVKGGGSYLSANDRRSVFGLGDAKEVERLSVRWPSGETQTWAGKDLGVNRYLRLTEGKPEIEARK
ncbi:MAG: CRTAC1 family protein [Pirellulaceae bacterium]|nr:CRTAC1 family protein [Pirellulaceae bacterium]